MWNNWSFRSRIGIGFGALLFVVLVITAMSAYSIRTVISAKDRIIETFAQQLIDAKHIESLTNERAAAVRGYLLSGEMEFLEGLMLNRSNFDSALSQMYGKVVNQDEKKLIDHIKAASVSYRMVTEGAIEGRKSNATPQAILKKFENEVMPLYKELQKSVNAFVDFEEKSLADSKRSSSEVATRTLWLVILIASICFIFASLFAMVFSRLLTNQVNTAVRVADEFP